MLYVVVLGLLALSGVFSGLNLGLMSLGPHELKRKAALGDSRAKRVYGVRRRGNLLLGTLLLGNVATISALSLVLNEVVPSVIAGLATTALITIFGEIIPQAVFSRYALQVGASTAWFVRLVMFVLYPIAAPLAWLLDITLGDELPTLYSRRELVD